jgi:DNA-binding NarL/FixJ family response regulator
VYAAAELKRPTEAPARPAGLTARETEVLRLIAQGATNKDIAHALHISVKTVNAHLNSIFTKVDCSTRAAAAAFAVRHGLV